MGGGCSILPIFEDIDFLVVSEDLLLFNGDPSDGVPGGGYGTLIKAPSIPAGNAGGTWETRVINDETTAEEWLMSNFKDESVICCQKSPCKGDDTSGGAKRSMNYLALASMAL